MDPACWPRSRRQQSLGMRAFAEARSDAPWIAAGNPLPGVEGFRRSHQQAHDAHAVAIASGSKAFRVTAASDPGLSTAALVGQQPRHGARLGRRGARSARVVHGKR